MAQSTLRLNPEMDSFEIETQDGEVLGPFDRDADDDSPAIIEGRFLVAFEDLPEHGLSAKTVYALTPLATVIEEKDFDEDDEDEEDEDEDVILEDEEDEEDEEEEEAEA